MIRRWQPTLEEKKNLRKKRENVFSTFFSYFTFFCQQPLKPELSDKLFERRRHTEKKKKKCPINFPPEFALLQWRRGSFESPLTPLGWKIRFTGSVFEGNNSSEKHQKVILTFLLKMWRTSTGFSAKFSPYILEP